MPNARVRFTRTDNLKGIRTRPLMAKIVRKGFDSLGRTLKSKLRGISPKDREVFIKSIYYTVTGNTLSTLSLTVASNDNEKKVAVIEKGRGRNKRRPPPEKMRGWVRRRGMTLKNDYRASRRLGPITPDRVKTPAQLEIQNKRSLRLKQKEAVKAANRVRPLSKREREIRTLAFLIGRSIGKKGIRGRAVFARTTRMNRDLIRRAIATMNAQMARELSAAF